MARIDDSTDGSAADPDPDPGRTPQGVELE
jgi:hypothetical protein